MQKGKKDRRIDYTREEMAVLANQPVTTFDDRVERICEKYKFGKS